MKEIPLTRGQVALVDDEFAPLLARWKWYFGPAGYACRGRRSMKPYKNIFMHNVIAFFHFGDIPAGYQVDHINGDRLNNQLENLRVITVRQNMTNKGKPLIRNTSSRYIGVHWHKDSKKWTGAIKVNGKYIFHKRYDTQEEAARARDVAAVKHFGEFARLNFPLSNYQESAA